MMLTEFAKRSICLILSLLMLLSLAACGQSAETPSDTTASHTAAVDELDTAETDTRFDGVKYDGREFRIYTSTNEASTMGTSNVFIEGSGQMGGGEIRRLVYTYLCCKKNNCMVQ